MFHSKTIILSFILSISLFSGTGVSDEPEFAAINGPCNLDFPSDHGPHQAFRTEWWYYTGNLTAEDGHRYGFQLTFFRYGLVPAGDARRWPVLVSAWRPSQLFFAHAAVTDIQGQTFFFAEKISRNVLGLAGISRDGDTQTIHLHNWKAEIAPQAHRLSSETTDFSFELTLTPCKPPVMHGDLGYSRKGDRHQQASCYYSFTNMESAGILTLQGQNQPVTGKAWMDHEFSSAPLDESIAGWDWFGLQLDNQAEIMLYALRLKSGGLHPASSGTYVDENGLAYHLANTHFHIETVETWKSPRTGAVYPSRWRIRIDSIPLDIEVSASVPDQELNTDRSTRTIYWEGSVSVGGSTRELDVQGHGYVELTGYADTFQSLR